MFNFYYWYVKKSHKILFVNVFRKKSLPLLEQVVQSLQIISSTPQLVVGLLFLVVVIP